VRVAGLGSSATLESPGRLSLVELPDVSGAGEESAVVGHDSDSTAVWRTGTTATGGPIHRDTGSLWKRKCRRTRCGI